MAKYGKDEPLSDLIAFFGSAAVTTAIGELLFSGLRRDEERIDRLERELQRERDRNRSLPPQVPQFPQPSFISPTWSLRRLP